MDYFRSSIRAQLPEGAELPEGNLFPFTTDVGEIIFIIPETDPETVICRAHVGSLANASDREDFLKSALAANLFWDASEGMTLSLGENDEVFLQTRYEDSIFENPDALGNTIVTVNHALSTWKARLNLAGGNTNERA